MGKRIRQQMGLHLREKGTGCQKVNLILTIWIFLSLTLTPLIQMSRCEHIATESATLEAIAAVNKAVQAPQMQ